jgi:hypothetical protein
MTYPDWLDLEAWQGYEDMRKAIKKPMTDRARGLALRQLVKFETLGHNHADVLDQSTFNAWQGLFEIKKPLTKNVSFKERDAEDAMAKYEAITGKTHPKRMVIDVTPRSVYALA